MYARNNNSGKLNRGIAYVMALLLLAVFAAAAVAFATVTDLALHKSENYRGNKAAQLSAESGLAFLVHELTNCGVNGCLRGQALLDNLATQLQAHLDGTPNLEGASVVYDELTIAIPEIAIDTGRSFTAKVTVPSWDTARLQVTGHFTSGTGPSEMTLNRKITMDFNPLGNPAFGFALCSKGPIAIGMNTGILGTTYAYEGSIYSGATGTAISVGSGEISGDVCTSDPDASVSLGGTHVLGEVRDDVPPITMPQVDQSIYIAAVPAWTIVDSPSPSGSIFSNVRINANTNPSFGSVTIRGVMHVQAPNYVQFTNNVSLTGVIVADDPPSGSPDSANYIYFKNNAAFHSVEELPSDDPAFAQLRNLPGTSVLAPGFTMEFKNNFNHIAGTVALKSLIAKNNLYSTLGGGILIYGSNGLDLKNNSEINVDLSKFIGPPPGFEGYGQASFRVNPDSYVERR